MAEFKTIQRDKPSEVTRFDSKIMRQLLLSWKLKKGTRTIQSLEEATVMAKK